MDINMLGGWKSALDDELNKEYFKELMKKVDLEYKEHICYPPKDEIFSALNYTDLSNVKVVIIGQDPYHDYNQAHGLAFSIPKSQKKFPPSLLNIFKEIKSETGKDIPENGNLIRWASQGVLLLNTVLTVREHEANSHKGYGWERFTDKIIEVLNEQDRPIVYMLWGKPAQTKGKKITNKKQLKLEGPHPSPLSSYRGFFGCDHFNKCNAFLKENGITQIEW